MKTKKISLVFVFILSILNFDAKSFFLQCISSLALLVMNEKINSYSNTDYASSCLDNVLFTITREILLTLEVA